ncbi:MAG: D-alanyl-D-alanine carboxypeptidase, partial [Tepidisphaerales bacterium]
MKRFPPFIVACVALCIAPLALADIDNDIAAILNDKLIQKNPVGVVIVRLDSAGGPGKLVYAHNPDTPLMPASNMKLLTTSAALDTLGPDLKFQTLLLQRGEDLILLGDGDPMFGDWEYLHKSNWDITSAMKLWAEKLKKANLTRCHNVLVDDTVFDQEFVHPNWPEQTRYCGEIAGMNLNIG